jgi:hypothetical protein
VLQKIIVRTQTVLRQLAGIDYTLEGYTDGCMVEPTNCFEVLEAGTCSDPCTWTWYDEGDPDGGGYCGGTDAGESFCAGESGRHSETIIDGDTSDGVSSLATTVADALDVLSEALPAGSSSRGPLCHYVPIFIQTC